MVVPAAVKQAEKEADEALEAISKAQRDNADDETATLDDAIEAYEQTPEHDSEQPEIEEDDSEQDEAEEAEGQELEADTTSEAPVQTGVGGEDYKQKYQTLMGKYNAEIPRLQQQISQMQQAMLLQQAHQQAPSTEKPGKPKGPAHARHLKPDELEDYGEDILDMQARMAKGVAEDVVEAALASKVSPYLERIAFLENQLVDSSNSSFWSKVESVVDGAKMINDSDPLWFDFLEKTEPNSGLSYREIGEHAFNTGDSERMARLLQIYQGASTGTEAPGSKKKPPVKPGKVANKTVKTDSKASRVFNESDIEQFYTDVAMGKYKGKEEKMKSLQDEIENALMEGRIRNR